MKGYAQDFTGWGMVGAIIFVLVPSVGGYWWASATGNALFWASVNVPGRAAQELPSLAILYALVFVWLLSIVLMLVGRIQIAFD